jgi:hypothetical protein
MSTVEAAIAELKSLSPAELEEAARFIHHLKLAGHGPEGLLLALAIGQFVSKRSRWARQREWQAWLRLISCANLASAVSPSTTEPRNWLKI